MSKEYLEVIVKNDELVVKVQDPTKKEPMSLPEFGAEKHYMFSSLINKEGYEIISLVSTKYQGWDADKYLLVRESAKPTEVKKKRNICDE